MAFSSIKEAADVGIERAIEENRQADQQRADEYDSVRENLNQDAESARTAIDEHFENLQQQDRETLDEYHDSAYEVRKSMNEGAHSAVDGFTDFLHAGVDVVGVPAEAIAKGYEWLQDRSLDAVGVIRSGANALGQGVVTLNENVAEGVVNFAEGAQSELINAGRFLGHLTGADELVDRWHESAQLAGYESVPQDVELADAFATKASSEKNAAKKVAEADAKVERSLEDRHAPEASMSK